MDTTPREFHVVVGAGPIGSGVARLLARQGSAVRVVTRSASGPVADGIERMAANAADAAAMERLTAGAAAIYNCANPAYHRWPQDWPPIAQSLLSAAERSGAVLVTISNLYAYGPAPASLGVASYDERHPLTEETPLAAIGVKGGVRRRMWTDALALHEQGRIRAVEIRSSDYLGRGAQSVMGDRATAQILAGHDIWAPGRADRLHTWTFIDDVVRMVVTAATDPRAWGRAWHTPSNTPRTMRDIVVDLADRAGRRPVAVHTLPSTALRALGVVWPLGRELRETEYQFREAFVMDSSAAQRNFGLAPTAWDAVIDAALAGHVGPDAVRPEPVAPLKVAKR